MDRQAAFEAWAPPGSPWSPWAKPVLFAHLPRTPRPAEPVPLPDLGDIPLAGERRALVVDLPGPRAVVVGLALAGKGYRPVPVFNACPPPAEIMPDPQEANPQPSPAVVDVDAILTALVAGVEQLRSLSLPADSPPAFLVDAGRQRPLQSLREGVFDNRSVLFTTDFPSGAFLASQRIEGVLLLRDRTLPLEDDLAHVLWTWQKAGIVLSGKDVNEPGPPQPLTVRRFGPLAGLWRRVAAFFRFRRNPLGGFGGFIPEAAVG